MINGISVNIPSQFLISKITKSSDNNFGPLSMNSRIGLEKFEPVPKFENNINEIKDNHLKSITSAAMNLSGITYFDKNIDPLSVNNISEAEKLEPEPTL